MNPRQLISNLFGRELVRVGVLLCALLALFFADVVFGRATFLTSTFTFLPSTMPEGPYGYTGHRTVSQPTRDSGASAWQAEPLNRLSERMFKSAQWPLWNPHAGAGVPLAANMHSGALYPPNALIFLIPDNAWEFANNSFTLLGFFIAGLFTYLFLRQINIHSVGAFGAAIAYTFCGRLIFYIGTADWRVDVLVPFLLWATERLYIKTNVASAWLVAVGVFLAITAGMPESTFFALLLASLYYAYRVFENWIGARRTARDLIARFIPFVIAALMGISFSAFLIIPFIEYVMLSWNVHPGGTGFALYPPESAISIIVPYFWGAVLQGWHYPGLGETMPYIGVMVALLALLAFERKSTMIRHAYFFGGIVILFLLKAFGVPLVQWISYLPLFNISIFPRFAGAAFMFSTAALAGIGLDNVSQGHVSLRRARIGIAILAGVIARFTSAHGQEILAKQQVAYVGVQVAIAMSLLLATAVTLSRARGAWWLTGLVAVELFIALPKDRVDKYDPFTTPPFVNFLLQEEQAPFRILGLDRILYPVTAGVYGLDDIRDLDALYPKRYSALIKKFIDPAFYDRFTGEATVMQTKFLDLLNVKYVLSTYPLLKRWQSTDLSPRFAEQCDMANACTGYHTGGVNESRVLQIMETASADQPATARLVVRVPPSRPFLRFEIAGESANAATVHFAVHAQVEDTERVLFARQVLSSPSVWEGNIIDLKELAGKDITLSFFAWCEPRCAPARGGWRNIELIEPQEEYAGVLMSSFLPLKQNLVAAQQQEIWVYDDGVRIYKNDEAFPRAFIVHDVLAAKGEEDALDKLASSDFDPHRQVVIEGVAAAQVPHAGPASDFAAPQIVNRNPGYVAIDVSVEQPGFLVLSDTFYPGWKALVNGKDTQVYIADYLFRAVQLESGRYRVEFVYDPWSYKIGLAISLSVWIAGIFGLIFSHRSEN